MARPLSHTAIPTQKGPLTLKLLGQYIRAKRTQANLAIDAAAELCGVSVVTLSKIETAKGGVRFESLLKVLHGLGLNLRVEER